MNYMKLLWAVAGAVALAVKGALADDGMSLEDYVTVGAAGLAALGTWLVPNTPALATAKTWVNALVLGSGVLVPLLLDGVTAQEWVTVLISVLTAVGVYALPNRQNRDFRLTD
jgi:hypothetical protein